ncbi:MAG: gamma-glutamyltransferase, partial [Bacteroidota bacterium]
MYRIASFLIAFTVLVSACTVTTETSSPPVGLKAESAMVVSAHPLASQVGVQILQQGGNAVDAAVAVQFALAVVYPVAGNIGGGGFMISRMHNGELAALDFRERAPLSGDRNMYLDSLGEVIPKSSTLGHLAAGVPGSVAGMYEAHQRYGTLPWSELVQPAINLAAQGFTLTEKESRSYNSHRDRFLEANTIAPQFLLKEAGWNPGDSVVMEDLAWTLTQVRDAGMEGFYTGPVAEKIVAEMDRGSGMISLEDLAQYEAVWREPVVFPYRGHRIISMPPASSGGIALAQLLQMVEGHPVAEMEPHSPEKIHLVTEAERRVYADRATHLGDTDFYPVPRASLIAAEYADERMATFDPSQATDSDEVFSGEFSGSPSEETTHFSIVDAQGNAVSITTTLNGGMGSHVVVDGAGFILNNEMDDFSIKPGYPNAYGLIGAFTRLYSI